MRIIKTIVVLELLEPTRLNTYCEKFVDFFESRKSVKKMISKGAVNVNNCIVPGGSWLTVGDKITILDLENTPPKAYHLEMPIIFEDNHLAIINKPAGLIVSGNQFKTLANTLSYNLKQSTETNRLPWPQPTHRIDNQTSGLVICAKTKSARISLGNQFENKEIEKTYYALCSGKLNSELKEMGYFDESINHKSAYTKFRIISESRSLKNDWLTLIKMSPKTGRTHQLRIHLSSSKIPILGDKLYAKNTIKHKGLFLAAVGLKFYHPITNECLEFSIPLPDKFKRRIENENRRWLKYNSQKS
ncbi:MAG: pseudouridine synthase [Crocinitomicaceae bacterium]